MDQKRFLLFVVLSVAIMWGYVFLQSLVAPPKRPGPPVAEEPGQAAGEGEPAAPEAEGQPAAPEGAGEAEQQEEEREEEEAPGEPEAPAEAAERQGAEAASPEGEPPGAAQAPRRFVTLGSVDPSPDNPYAMLVTLTSQGGAIARIELSEPKYRDLDYKGGYLGHLELAEAAPPEEGVEVRVVGPGTPAAEAAPETPGPPAGLRPGDVIVAVDELPVRTPLAFERHMRERTRPGDQLRLRVRRREADGPAREIIYVARLIRRPLQVIRPEPEEAVDPEARDPLSCLLTLQPASSEWDLNKPPPVTRPLREDWETRVLDGPRGRTVEFRYRLSEGQAKRLGAAGQLELVKRYRLAPSGGPAAASGRRYHLEMELEIRNLDAERSARVAYRLSGPNGLPLEGWWYSYKVHPRMFRSAGVRDVIWRTADGGHMLLGCSEIQRFAVKHPEAPAKSLIQEPQRLRYIGVDAQYFTTALTPAPGQEAQFQFMGAAASALGDFQQLQGRAIHKTNVTFQLLSQPLTIAPGQSHVERFRMFAGPKDPAVLAAYGLNDAIQYGWFPWIAKPLSWVLHLFYRIVWNYGLAIIMLTVLVRGAMFPISRKAAKNAQMMQQLAPEMKKIAEQYKNDLEKRTQAQRELYRKYNFNPFSGCLLMFLQLPIFIGLYRCLAVDIHLRQAPLIPGLAWCSNLAAPDMLVRWDGFLPAVLASETGWLGPYLNVLPIITIALFIVQQKMFTPPPADEQQQMQQKMMTYMMIFIGVLFFKVPSGLCLYFIASSIWGVAERRLVGKPGAAPAPAAAAAKPPRRPAKAAKTAKTAKTAKPAKQKEGGLWRALQEAADRAQRQRTRKEPRPSGKRKRPRRR